MCRVDIACLQISFTNNLVSLLYSMSLGICQSFMRLTWPSQPSRLWLSKANMLGNPACATTSLFGTSLARWCLKSFWGSAGEKYWVCALGRSRGSRSCYYRAACLARRPGILSSCCWWSTWCCPRSSFWEVPVLLLLGQFVCSFQCLGRGCWRWWNLGNWSPPPPWECSRRWRCLGCC